MRAHVGDAKVLLAWDLPQASAKDLAGFTIRCAPKGKEPFYLPNMLQFEHPERHAQDPAQPPTSSVNAPLHKFRWLHVPAETGEATYTVTPRTFQNGALQPLDPGRSESATVTVGPFAKGPLKLAFTRGYVQSQAYVERFGAKAKIGPDQFEWLGFTARKAIFGLLEEVEADPALRLDVLAYDLDEPGIVKLLLELGEQGRARVILDDAKLHHSVTKPKPEDDFAAAFKGEIKRGHVGNFAHDKVLLVSDAHGPRTVLTGSTNFSITGLYVNSNHVLVFDDRTIAAKYREVFQATWDADVKRTASAAFDGPPGITFAPHAKADAHAILERIADRVEREQSNVLFAVMETKNAGGPVFPALNALHSNQGVFSYGVSDSPGGIFLYRPGTREGVMVSGRPNRTRLPKPFNQVAGIGSNHQIHHKFVICGFNGADPVLFCGSSNLSLGGETSNADNLIEIHDPDVVTAFAIEALALVDHFQFLDKAKAPKTAAPPADKARAAVDAQWFLSTTDRWADSYYDPDDLHSVDRRLFST